MPDLFGSGGGGGWLPRPPPPPPPPRPAFGSTSVPSSFTPAPVPPLAPTSIDAEIVEGVERGTSRPMRPMIGLVGRPLPLIFVHVLPASVVFQMPLPAQPPLNPHGWRRR